MTLLHYYWQILYFGVILFNIGIHSEPDSGLIMKLEIPLIKQLRERVRNVLTQPIMYEDQYLVRFLRAQNLNLLEAETMMQKMLTWRHQEKMDQIFSEDWSMWLKNYQVTEDMVDFHGKRVFSPRIGRLNVRKLILSGKQLMMDRYLVYGFERTVYNFYQAWTKTGLIDGYLLIDLAGFNTRTHACVACIPSWIKMVVTYENYYPRLYSKVIVVNAPRVFDTVFGILKSVLTGHTLKHTYIYDHNKSYWSSELFKFFPKKSLSLPFGGTGPFIPIVSLHNTNWQQLIYYNTTIVQ